MTDQQSAPDPVESSTGDPLVMTAGEHSRNDALYIAVDIARAVTPGPNEDVETRAQAVLAAADSVYAWLTQPAPSGTAA